MNMKLMEMQFKQEEFMSRKKFVHIVKEPTQPLSKDLKDYSLDAKIK